MKLEDIMDMWDKDSHIDRSQLDVESLKIPQLHHKYYKVLLSEIVRLKTMQLTLTSLKKDKEEFYVDGPNEETKAKGWTSPPKGRIMRGARPDLDSYIQADQDVQLLVLKIAAQNEKVEYLKSIIDSINRRTFVIKNALEFLRFTNGQ